MATGELKSKEGTGLEPNRILNKDLILFLLDLEVKRGRRYQNFLSILILDLIAVSNGDGGGDFESSYEMLSTVLMDKRWQPGRLNLKRGQGWNQNEY